jgi:mevalonate kinase
MDQPGSDQHGFTDEELQAQDAAALPEREALSPIKAGGLASGIDNFAMPINEAIAINNESVSSIAIADADQIVILEQTDTDGGA